MSYSCDCQNVYFIQEPVGTCSDDAINFGLPAPIDGIYKLRLTFLNEEITINISNIIFTGEDLTFPVHGLNENYTWMGIIYKPNGDKYTYTDGNNKVYDCFSFQTVQAITL